MNNIKNSRKSTQKVCRELKENKNSGLQDNTHFQAIGCSWKVKFVNSVIFGDFEGGEIWPTANFLLEYTHPGTVGSCLNSLEPWLITVMELRTILWRPKKISWRGLY